MKRQTPLTTGATHHVYSKSISHFQIFNTPVEYERFLRLLRFYRFSGLTMPFSYISKQADNDPATFEDLLAKATENKEQRTALIAYCLMPTHFHLILRQEKSCGIERFVADVCNSYTHYFNLRHTRKGPLWQNRFGNSPIWNAQELREATRYIHLNPTTAYLVDHPAYWTYSSFGEYIGRPNLPIFCEKGDALAGPGGEGPEAYELYVIRHIEAQRLLKKAKTVPAPGAGRKIPE